MEYNENKLFSEKIRVRINDLNYGNHVCHTKFISMLHNARALFLKKHGFSEHDFFGSALVILNFNIDYLTQCFFDEELIINITTIYLQKASIHFEYEIINTAKKIKAIKATSIMGLYNKESNMLKRPTKACIEFLNSFQNIGGVKK